MRTIANYWQEDLARIRYFWQNKEIFGANRRPLLNNCIWSCFLSIFFYLSYFLTAGMGTRFLGSTGTGYSRTNHPHIFRLNREKPEPKNTRAFQPDPPQNYRLNRENRQKRSFSTGKFPVE